MNTQALTVNFHNQSLIAVVINSVPHVAMKPICDNIGLQWEAQLKRIKRHPVLSATMSIMDMVAEDGRRREMVMLPIDYLNGWLFSVDANRVKPEIKGRLIDYQRECFRVLSKHFLSPAEPMQAATMPMIALGRREKWAMDLQKRNKNYAEEQKQELLKKINELIVTLENNQV